MNKGCFIGLKLKDKSLKNIVNLQKQLSLKHPVLSSKLHLTLLCSHDKVEQEIEINPELDFKTKTIGLRQLKTLDGTSMLVIALESKDLTNRHIELQNINNISHYYNNYKPHITIATNLSPEDAIVIKKFKTKELNIVLTSEYMEPLK